MIAGSYRQFIGTGITSYKYSGTAVAVIDSTVATTDNSVAAGAVIYIQSSSDATNRTGWQEVQKVVQYVVQYIEALEPAQEEFVYEETEFERFPRPQSERLTSCFPAREVPAKARSPPAGDAQAPWLSPWGLFLGGSREPPLNREIAVATILWSMWQSTWRERPQIPAESKRISRSLARLTGLLLPKGRLRRDLLFVGARECLNKRRTWSSCSALGCAETTRD